MSDSCDDISKSVSAPAPAKFVHKMGLVCENEHIWNRQFLELVIADKASTAQSIAATESAQWSTYIKGSLTDWFDDEFEKL